MIDYVVSNCVVESCQAKYQGGGANGGIWYDSVIRNCKVTNTKRSAKKLDGYGEEAGSGGGVWGGVLYNCTISGNSSFAAGAGLAGGIAANATTLIPGKAYDCVIKDNYANVGPGGGAGGDDEVMCVLERCWIEHNLTTNHLGGAMDARGGGVALCRVIDCTITNCSANYAGSNVGMGGGVFKSVCSGTVLAQNFATGSGGGIFGGSCSNCVIRENRADWNYGGGTYNTRTYNCIVVSNASGQDAAGHSRGYHEGDIVCFNESKWPRDGYGSAICNSEGSDPCVVVNCTVYYNSGSTAALSHTVMTNVLIWGAATAFGNVSAPMVNCFWYTGAGTAPAGSVGCKTATNAGFVGGSGDTLLAAAKNDLHALELKASSPCRNAGVNHPWMIGAKDVFGADRICREIVDIGALERESRGIILVVK